LLALVWVYRALVSMDYWMDDCQQDKKGTPILERSFLYTLAKEDLYIVHEQPGMVGRVPDSALAL
jgi:hypothetical protein